MEVKLDEYEARVLGVLIEKDRTTPEQYPLSLNATMYGANQKSNRDPVVQYTQSEVLQVLKRLQEKQFVVKIYPVTGRTEKYRHAAESCLSLEPVHVSVLAELMMRGAQAAGELRQRASRMTKIETLAELSEILGQLMDRGFVRRLPPVPGSRAERFTELLSPGGTSEEGTRPATSQAPSDGDNVGQRKSLEVEVAQLRRQLDWLADKLGHELPE